MKYRNREDGKEVNAHPFSSKYPYQGAKLGWVSKKSGKPISGEPKSTKSAERVHIFFGTVVRDGDYILVEQNGTSYAVTADDFVNDFKIA